MQFFRINDSIVIIYVGGNIMKKIKIEFTEQELTTILNGFSVRALSDNIDEEDKKIARKIIKALKEVEKK